MATWEIVGRLPSHSPHFATGQAGIAIQQAPDATGRRPIAIHSFDSDTGMLNAEPVATLDVPGKGVRYFSLEFSPSGDVLVGTGSDRTVYRWNVRTRQLIDILKGHESIVRQMAFFPCEEALATAELNGSIKFWSPKLASHFQQLSLEKYRPDADPLTMYIPAIALSVNRTTFKPIAAALNSKSSVVHVFDDLNARSCLEIASHKSAYRLKVTRDGRRLGMVFQGGIQVWNLDQKEFEHQLQVAVLDQGVVGFDLSSDGRLMAAGRYSGGCHVLNLLTRQVELAIPVEGGVRNLGFSPDGTLLAILSGEQVLSVWNVEKKCEVWKRSFNSRRRLTVVYSDDGRKGHTLIIPSNFVFSEDGLQLAVTMNGEKVSLLQSESGDVLTEFDAQGVEVLEFTPDGSRLASYGSDLTVKLWDIKTGREILVLQTDQDRLTQLRFVDEGRRLVGIGLTGVYSWDTRPVSHEVSDTADTSDSP